MIIIKDGCIVLLRLGEIPFPSPPSLPPSPLCCRARSTLSPPFFPPPQGEIPSLLAAGTPFDAVLANALYFKGLWSHPFDKR